MFTYLLERRKRCKDAQGLKIGKWGGDPSSSVGTEGLPAPRRRRRGRAGDPRAAQGALSPRQPQAALPRVPYRSCPGGRRSPGAVAGRGVQGALWPSGAGGRSGHGDAGGFAEDPRLQHLGRPAAALRPRPGSAALLRDPRGCGGPGARCGLAGAGPQQQRRLQPLQEWEASRRRLGPGRCPPGEAVGSGTTPPGHAEAAAAAARGECGAARSRARWPSVAQEGPGGKSSGRADGASCRGGRLPTPRLGRGVGGASDLPPRVPREAGSAWGATRPRDAGKPSLRPGQRGGRVCEAGGWQGRWQPLDWPRAWESAAS